MEYKRKMSIFTYSTHFYWQSDGYLRNYEYLCILKSNLIIYCNNREVIINHETITSIKQTHRTEECDA